LSPFIIIFFRGMGFISTYKVCYSPSPWFSVCSFLWWWPFVLHITRPVVRITRNAEQIALGHYALPEHQPAIRTLHMSRRDEIKRLGDAVDSMSSQLMRQMFGQRRFIRQIAHELGSPIARMKFGLAVLEERVDEETSVRVRRLSKDMGEIAVLVEGRAGLFAFRGVARKAHAGDRASGPGDQGNDRPGVPARGGCFWSSRSTTS
jgi:two-component system sensor histidine kinase CpxA